MTMLDDVSCRKLGGLYITRNENGAMPTSELEGICNDTCEHISTELSKVLTRVGKSDTMHSCLQDQGKSLLWFLCWVSSPASWFGPHSSQSFYCCYPVAEAVWLCPVSQWAPNYRSMQMLYCLQSDTVGQLNQCFLCYFLTLKYLICYTLLVSKTIWLFAFFFRRLNSDFPFIHLIRHCRTYNTWAMKSQRSHQIIQSSKTSCL